MENTMSLLYGLHTVYAALKHPLRQIQAIYILNSRNDQRMQSIIDDAKAKQIKIIPLTQKALENRFPNINHQGCIAEVSPLPKLDEKDIFNLIKQDIPLLLLILDGVTDPHNLGACIRTADATGVHAVIIPKDKNASITPVVSKVACGATETIPVISVTNLARTIEQLKSHNCWVYGADGEANTSLYQLDLKGSIAIILGAEGTGLRRLTKESCDQLFSIPMLGSVESLNVSVATGVCLYEVVRQKIICQPKVP